MVRKPKPIHPSTVRGAARLLYRAGSTVGPLDAQLRRRLLRCGRAILRAVGNGELAE
jgi:hypothetical protein